MVNAKGVNHMSIQNCPGFIYTVQRGDTMFRLAQRFGITLEQLIAANPQVTDPNRLTIGQQLCIPTGAPGSVPPCPNGTLYTVRQGDTMFLIAQRFNVSLNALIAANPQVADPNRIQVGQVLCIPGVMPPPPECVGGFIYTIRPGDTLFLLAQRFNTTVEAIMAANPGINPQNLQIGQRICIPQPSPGPCTGQLYTVRPGDTLFLIAQRFGVSLQALIAANLQISDPNLIFPGQVICIPGVQPPQCVGGTIHIIQAGDTLFNLAAFYGTTVNAIIAANPGIDPQNLQVGQAICIPLPQPAQCTGQLYTVVTGDTMASIAARFGVSLAALIAANPQIADPARIFPGQIICIPAEAPQCIGGTIHIVRPGDTLFNLAAFYGTTVNAIIAANPGIDPQNLRIGQRLCIPLPQPAQCSGQLYTVQPGDSLFTIANRFGVTVEMLIAANPQIADPARIFPGQIICIPRSMPTPVDRCSFELDAHADAPKGATAMATLDFGKGTATVKASGMPRPQHGRSYVASLVMMHGEPERMTMMRTGSGEYAAMFGPSHKLHECMRVLVSEEYERYDKYEQSGGEYPSGRVLFSANVQDKCK